jgi:hypothetical protein
MTKRKKRMIAVAFVVWALGAFYLASKTFDYYRSGTQFNDDDIAALKQIMFPSLKMRDQD